MSPSQSDTDDSSAEEEKDEQKMEEENELESPKLTREELKPLFSQYNEFSETQKE